MFIGREIRRSHAFRRGEQAAKLGVTPKSLFGDLLEINKRRAVLREFALKFGQSCVVAFERFGSATLSIQQAFLRDVLLPAFVVLDSLQRRAIARFLSLVDSGFSLFVPRPELCLCGFVSGFFLADFRGSFRFVSFDLLRKPPLGALGVDPKFASQLFFVSGELPDGDLEVVQEGDSLTDRQMATHNRS